MVDETTTDANGVEAGKTKDELKLPESFEQLREALPILNDLPELKAPQKLSVSEVIDLEQLFQFWLDGNDRIKAILDGDETDERGLSKAMRLNGVYAQRLELSVDFFRSLAVDPDVFDGWTEGRSMDEMADAFDMLIAFYKSMLGKGRPSRSGRHAAQSN